jgi:SAM-dependent methyltransferase
MTRIFRSALHFTKERLTRAILKVKVLLGVISQNAAIFEHIYRMRIWGTAEGEKYFSGEGSIEDVVKPYNDFVGAYIKQHQITSVVDLGCGDFRASRMIDLGDASYIGVDVVKDVIRINSQKYQSQRTRFLCLDIIHDELPEAELCLIKQVLQHLCDKDIQGILAKLAKYQHVLIMDGLVQNNCQVNKDIKTGYQR